METLATELLETVQKRKGTRITVPEETIIHFLLEQRIPMAGEDIFMWLRNHGSTISYATVYTTLKRLTILGILNNQKQANRRHVLYGISHLLT
ncbi:transcriptional repressor [Parapedobacter koreensis]|uniref:Ferric uptake regulator family protein n=1 Tax=Parapedobacter koreensis TaxID=332977 RepID=A0A1H7JV37_9SPHI|nr:transcriptional repressor [Parapedobacter koreensis]SEK78488.1 Ferric uptake regulator family protein [Parapedobacter koreensis]